jgi:vacuolar-type H+-ATPase subunit H
MAHGSGSTGAGETSIGALKELKAVETEWAAKLADARAAAQQRLARAREMAEAAVSEARAEIDRLRESTLATNRTQAQSEAEALLSEGKRAAQAIAKESLQSASALKGKLLDVVLRGFRGSNGATR